jgi:hypothetical protein
MTDRLLAYTDVIAILSAPVSLVLLWLYRFEPNRGAAAGSGLIAAGLWLGLRYGT